MRQQAEFYRTSVNSADCNFDSDILALQMAAVLLGPSHFLYICLHHFSIHENSLWNLHSSAGSFGFEQRHVTIMLEELLALVILVAISERSLCGASTPQEELRREIIQYLSVANMPHSQILKSVTARYVKLPQMDKIIESVSTYTEPTSTEPGRYHLKPECWTEFDPYFRYISVGNS